VVFERLAGQIAMFAVLRVAFVATLAVPGGLDWPRWLAPVGPAGAWASACPLVAGRRHLPGAAGRGMRSCAAPSTRRWPPASALPGQIVLSLGTTLCNLAAFAFCARAVGVDLSLGGHVAALVPLILLRC
jgi:hypothetical protein